MKPPKIPPSTMTLAELEEKLGPADEFTLTIDSRRYLALWAIAIGIPPVQVYAMDAVQLTNLYHERGQSPSTDLQRIAGDMFLRIMSAVQSAKVDPDFLRDMIRKEIDNLPTRKLEIIGPITNIILDGLQHYMTEPIIRIASMGHPIMMVGPAGCGKTTIGNHTAQALNLPFYITSTINSEHQLSGFVDGYGVYHRTPFRNAFEHGGVWVADEIDAWDAGALLAANSALANGYSVFPDNPAPIARHINFRMVATANTFGHGADRIYIGRNDLDAASLDRFATVPIDYDLNLERIFCGGNIEWLQYVWKIRKAVNENKIRHVVSSRAILYGATAIQNGIARSDVEEWYLFKGMSERDREKLTDTD